MAIQHKYDLKFFTNDVSETLYERFIQTLKDVQHFDVLVGYFRTSGFKRLYKSLESVDKIRILIGLSIDKKAFELIEMGIDNTHEQLGFNSHQQIKDDFKSVVTEEMDTSEDSLPMEISARKFIEFIASGKLELRAHPSKNIHAKVYISRFHASDRDFGRVITGSSNFSENGLRAQREFNVELKDAPDVQFALERFEALWAEGVDISETYVDTLRKSTWLNDTITPYQLYLKFLYEYFKEDINLDQEIDIMPPEGFMELEYQKQAVVSAMKILEAYNGVFLADVVGLGKTFISALLFQQLAGRKLIICPPVLINYWRETMFEFGVPQCRVVSLGKLENLLNEGLSKYRYVLIDEAHRFRNEMTSGYEALSKICQNKKVILVSATPLNNYLTDILALLKLFQPARKGNIPGTANLQVFFDKLRLELQKVLKECNNDKADPDYVNAVIAASSEVRNKVLRHVMVRRTRSEVRSYFSDDLDKQGLSFPELMPPERIIYSFDPDTEQVFDDTIKLLKEFSYARYAPLLFLKKDVDQLLEQSQKNVRGFMKGVLVKRLESSFHAFKLTVERFIASYEQFIEMFKQGRVYISKKVDVYELLDNDDEAKLMALVEEGEAQTYASSDFKDDYQIKLNQDLVILQQIKRMWQNVDQDPKLEQFIQELKTNPVLTKQQLVIFTESTETGSYLQEKLEPHFKHQTMFFSSQGGRYQGVMHGSQIARDLITQNFDPNSHTKKNDVRLLITTDVLAEGINLHRASIVLNYDLPWNPTRVLQRVGRVNRVGTTHDKVYVFNFFPTDQSDAHLGLENNIKAKLQSFHDTLGEDAQYLSTDEEVSTHGLFGSNLYEKLSSQDSLESKAEERSELKYLKLIRDIRDEQPELFENVKRLPKKSRSGRNLAQEQDSLLTFFRRGKLKKFFRANDLNASELDFFDAIDLIECEEDEERANIPHSFYEFLGRNKERFVDATTEEAIDIKKGGGHSNEKKLLSILKAKEIRHFKGFTDDDENYLKQVVGALEAGVIPRRTIKSIMDYGKSNTFQPHKLLANLKKHLQADMLVQTTISEQASKPREVILSAFLAGK